MNICLEELCRERCVGRGVGLSCLSGYTILLAPPCVHQPSEPVLFWGGKVVNGSFITEM